MNSNSLDSKVWVVGIAGTLLLGATSQAYARDGMNFREFREQNPDAQRREARQMFQQLKQEFRAYDRNLVPSISVPQVTPSNATMTTRNSISDLTNPRPRVSNHSKQFNDAGHMIRLNRGIDLDLTSTVKNITLGNDLFQGQASVQIAIGNETKTLSAGSQVSAAEYVAVKQVLGGGSQQLTLDRAGRATGGTLDLSALTQDSDVMRASNLVVAKEVTTYGDFGKRSDFRLLGDLENHGTVHALSTSNAVRGGTIRAEDINNFSGANITSAVDLSLDASGNLTNAGSISSNGSLTLTAGGALTNSGTVNAKGDVTVASANVNNSGSISSESNLNLSGTSGLNLTVNNNGGVLAAKNGAINVRDAAYSESFNSRILGGDLLSKELNIHSGLGSADVAVNQLTGLVNQTGTAAHVLAQTDLLNIGTVCLTGDPTYYNTAGDINIAGSISVAEKLTFVAAGNITSADNIDIVAGDLITQGFDITFIAGAGFEPTGGSDSPNPPTTANPGGVILTGKASKFTNLLGEKGAGGSIDLGANVNVAARASLTPVGTTNGGDIFMYAFEGKKGDGTGRVLIEGATLRTGGSGLIGNNGNVEILASASEGEAIRTGNIDTTGGTGNSNGKSSISLGVAKIYNPVKKIPVEYDAFGARISNSALVAFGAREGGITITQTGGVGLNARNNISIFGGDVLIDGAVTARNEVFVTALGSITSDAAAPPITANTTAASKVTFRADKGSIGEQGNAVKVDTEILRIENEGPLANIEVVNSGDLLINGATSGGNLNIIAEDRVVVSDGNVIQAGANLNLSSELFFDMGPIVAGASALIRSTSGDLLDDPFTGGILAPRLVLVADNGNVGANTSNRFVLGGYKEVEVRASGGVFTQMTDTKKGATYTGIDAGQEINIRAAGPLTIAGLTDSGAGATDIEIDAGTLTIAGVIQATDSLRLVNNNVKGKMIFDTGADLDTLSASNGDIFISLGPISATPFTPTDNVTITGAGGTATFTGFGFKAKAPTNTFTLKGADITVNNGVKAGNMLFNGDVSITADPPVAAGTPTFFISYENDTTRGAASPTTLHSDSVSQNSADTNLSLFATTPVTNLLETRDARLLSNTLSKDSNGESISVLTSAQQGSSSNTTFMSIQQPSSLAHNADVVTEETKLTEGNKLFIASKDMTVETDLGTLQLSAGAVVLASAGKSHLSVYNLHDAGGVRLVAGGKRFTLLPGKHATVSPSRATSFAEVNELEAIAHRNIQLDSNGRGQTIFCSEFSLPSAVSAVKPLKALYASSDKEARKLTSKLTKTAAVLMHLNNDNYEFQVKPRMVALR